MPVRVSISKSVTQCHQCRLGHQEEHSLYVLSHFCGCIRASLWWKIYGPNKRQQSTFGLYKLSVCLCKFLYWPGLGFWMLVVWCDVNSSLNCLLLHLIVGEVKPCSLLSAVLLGRKRDFLFCPIAFLICLNFWRSLLDREFPNFRINWGEKVVSSICLEEALWKYSSILYIYIFGNTVVLYIH